MSATSPAALIKNEILSYLPGKMQQLLQQLKEEDYQDLEEIRLRCGQPLLLRLGERELAVSGEGRLTPVLQKGYRVEREDIWRMIASISDNSLYAFEEDIRRGFITIPGGHRVGLAGQVVLKKNHIQMIKDFGSICFRIAREVIGCADPVMPALFAGPKGLLQNTLIVSPPRCGKTTLLRDIARLISKGSNRPGLNVAVVDERSEIAGCYKGVPQLDVGPRTDILDGCPKDLGMMMAIRALSPQVVVTDEIGREGDAEAVMECIHAGVTIISTAHAGNLEELRQRPILRRLMADGVFQLVIILSRRHGPGNIEQVIRWDA
ncbi:MAG: stage III sporulation protein AA [Syntrophomonadaceae bacterium]|jgi:stage III sporulation protein AA